MKHRGFALVELIVVVVVLLVLAAILFPMFARSRSTGSTERRNPCSSNLKQIGLGFMQYTQDYDGKLPQLKSSGGWVVAVQPYLKSYQLFQCPLDSTGNGQSSNPISSGFTDYWFNSNLLGVQLKYVVYESRTFDKNLPYPASTLLSGDGNDGSQLTDASYNISSLPQSWREYSNSPAQRHEGYGNYLFADGHFKRLAPDQITTVPPASGNYTFALK